MRHAVIALALLGALAAACGSVSADDDGDDTGGVDAGSFDGGSGACPNACDPNATCQGTMCVCNSGFDGNGESCTDVNECMTDNGGCDVNADCNNVPGSRECECKPGFVGNGLTCQQPWLMLGSFPGVDLDPEGFGGKATAVGSTILFGPETNNANATYMRAFDTMQSTLSSPRALPPEAQSDFCACGLGDAFLGAGSELYMLGNDGYRYTVGNNAWTLIPSYIDPFRRGEAAGVFHPGSGAIYLIGGRDNQNGVVRMSVPGHVFTSLAGTTPFAVENAGAWTLSTDGLIYVVGGSGGNRRHLAAFEPSSGWTMLADAPVTIAKPLGVGEFEGRLWVAVSGGLHFYRPSTNQWDGFIASPLGLEAAVTANGGTYVLCKGAAGAEIYRLLVTE